jgi:hypothetical protein
MELTERYLQAVRFWLPRDQSQDIIAELSEDLKSELEEQRGQLGRDLKEHELVELLRRRGDPMQVAQRYLPQRYLIGPALYPLYWFVLKMALYVWAVPWLLVWLGYLIFSPAYRAAPPGLAQVHNLGTLWISLVYWAFMVTIGFAVLERRGGLARLGWRWNPHKLPRLAPSDRISRMDSIAGAAWNAIVALWWAGLLKLPALPDVQISPLPIVLHYYYWPILAVLFALVVVETINAVRPVWTRRRAVIRVAVGACAVAVIGGLLALAFMDGLITVAGPNLTADATRRATRWINLTWTVTLSAIAVGFIWNIIRAAQIHRAR